MKQERYRKSIYIDKINKLEYITRGEEDIIIPTSVGDYLLFFLNCNIEDISIPVIFWNEDRRWIEQNNTSKSKLQRIREDFISVIDYVYNLYDIEEIKDLTPYERYYVLTRSRLESPITQYSDDLHFNLELDPNWYNTRTCTSSKEKYVIEKIKENGLIPCPYLVSSSELSNILYFSLKEIITIPNIQIKRCKNCNRYFIPVNRTDEVFCSHKNEDGKTCKEIGFWQVKKRKYQEDDIARLYRNTYQQKLLRARRNPEIQEYANDLEKFRNEYKVIKKDIADGKKTQDDFKKWLLSVKRNIR